MISSGVVETFDRQQNTGYLITVGCILTPLPERKFFTQERSPQDKAPVDTPLKHRKGNVNRPPLFWSSPLNKHKHVFKSITIQQY